MCLVMLVFGQCFELTTCICQHKVQVTWKSSEYYLLPLPFLIVTQADTRMSCVENHLPGSYPLLPPAFLTPVPACTGHIVAFFKLQQDPVLFRNSVHFSLAWLLPETFSFSDLLVLRCFFWKPLTHLLCVIIILVPSLPVELLQYAVWHEWSSLPSCWLL